MGSRKRESNVGGAEAGDPRAHCRCETPTCGDRSEARRRVRKVLGRALVVFFLFSIACLPILRADQSNSQVINFSGGTITIQNGISSTYLSLTYTWYGQPISPTVIVQGCTGAGACTTIDTYTSSLNTQRLFSSLGTTYAYFTVQASWTGGSNYISLNVNSYLQSPSSSGGTPTRPAGSTYAFQYNNSGTFGAAGPGLAGQTPTSNGSGSAPTLSFPTIAESSNSPVSSSAYTLKCPSATTGLTGVDATYLVRFTSGASAPVVPLSTGTNCTNTVFMVLDDGAGPLTFSVTSGDTFKVFGQGPNNDGATSVTIQNGQQTTFVQGFSGGWDVYVGPTGAVGVIGDTASTVTIGVELASFHFNQNATAATAITYTLPPAALGLQKCVANGYNGSAADTGALTVQTSASGQYIFDLTAGTLSASGGYVISGGAAGDEVCLVGVSTTRWALQEVKGTWTVH